MNPDAVETDLDGVYWRMQSDDHRDEVLQWLRREDLGFDQVGSSDEYVLSPASRARFLHVPVLTLPPDVLTDYVRRLSSPSGSGGTGEQEALSMAALHVVEALTVDHGNGMNATTSLGFRRGRRGVAEFFVEVGRAGADPDDGVGGPSEWVADRPR